MADRNLDLALRIKADLAEGRKGLQEINQAIDETGKKADTTNTSLGGTSQRFDALLNSVDRVVRVLESMDARMAAFAAGSAKAAQATEQVSATTQAAAEGVRKLAETEDEAAARIRAVIAASREQQAAQQQAVAGISDVADQVRQHSDAAENTAAAVARQNAQMRQSSVVVAEQAAAERKAAAATENHTAELAKLLGQIDPTVAALERLDQQEAELQRFRSLGVLDEEGFVRFRNQVEQSRQALGRMGVSAGQTAQAMRMLPAQLTDVTVSLAAGMPVWMVFLQQGGQIKDSFGGWRPALQNILGLLTPTRVAIGGLVGALSLLAVGLVKGYLEAQRLESALLATGNYAGTTASELQALAETVGATSGAYGDASQAVLLLAQSGKITGDSLADATRGAVAFAQLTGRSIEDAVQAVVSLGERPADAVRKLDQQYHFLEASVYAQIRALQDQGRETEAAALAQRAFADAMESRQQRDVQNLGFIQRAWRELNSEMARGWDLLKGIGSQSLQQQLDQLYAARGSLETLASLPGGGLLYSGSIAAIDKQIAALKEQQAAEKDSAKAEADHRAEQEKGSAAIDHIATLTAKYATAQERYKATLDDINKTFDDAIAATPAKAGQLNEQRSQMLRAAVDQYAKSLASAAPKARRGADDAEARAAEAAQQGLLQSLQQLQGQLDPSAAAWVKYNQAVAQANQQAEQAKKAPGANAAAIDAERTAVIGLAKTIRDAELDRLAEQDRQAWEQLRQSLRTPTEASIETAEAQIKQLNDLLAKGVINAQQYHESIQRIGEKSVVAAPQYQGVDAAVGGVSSELAKNFAAQKALDDWHAQQLAANEAFRAEDEANEEAYQARKAEIERQYGDQRLTIEQSRHQLSLTASSEFFGQLAVLQQSSNRKIATIGKAAAIAKAMIDTYQSATAAYAAMASIPYVGPALGAAAAAAAIAAGLANVAQIRSQPTGYATGGAIRGAGTGTSDSILIKASNGEFMQRTAAVDYYGLDFMHAVNNLEYPRFAEGGAIADAPRLSAPDRPTVHLSSSLSTRDQSARRPDVQKHVHVWDRDQAAQEIAGTSAFEEAVLHVVGNNPTTIRGRWGS